VLFAACFLAAPSALAAPTSSAETGFVRAVNAARASVGLRPVELDPTLARAARSHSLEMLQANEFSHTDFGGRMAAFNVRGTMMGENLAWGSGPYGAVGAIVKEWLASPEHRANLLRAGYKRIGIGVARGTFQGYDGATIVTADFAG
jgi:streptogrisin C